MKVASLFVALLFASFNFAQNNEQSSYDGFFFTFSPKFGIVDYWDAKGTSSFQYSVTSLNEDQTIDWTNTNLTLGVGIGLDLGYHFDDKLNGGIYGDFKLGGYNGASYNIGGFVGYRIFNSLEVQGRIGWEDDGNNYYVYASNHNVLFEAKGLVYGINLNLNLPEGSNRFDYGFRLGFYYLNRQSNTIGPYSYFDDNVKTDIDGSLNIYKFDLGFVFKWF